MHAVVTEARGVASMRYVTPNIHLHQLTTALAKLRSVGSEPNGGSPRACVRTSVHLCTSSYTKLDAVSPKPSTLKRTRHHMVLRRLLVWWRSSMLDYWSASAFAQFIFKKERKKERKREREREREMRGNREKVRL